MNSIANFLALKLAKLFVIFLLLVIFRNYGKRLTQLQYLKVTLPSHFPLDYRPILTTPVISKVYIKLISK